MNILAVHCAAYDSWKEMYESNSSFREIWKTIKQPTIINETPFLDYTMQYGWQYRLNQIYVFQSTDHLILITEVHASSYGGHFRNAKILLHLQRHFYWPAMSKQVESFIRECALCSQRKPSN
jgi:hypothetical protein